MMFENAPELLTRRQAQELLQVSKGTMLDYIRSGNIPAVTIAGSYRIKKEDLVEFIMRL